MIKLVSVKKKWRAGETHVHPKQVQPRGGGGEEEEGASVVCIPINQTARLLLRVLGEPLTSACKHIAGASWSPAFPEQTKTRLVQRAQHHWHQQYPHIHYHTEKRWRKNINKKHMLYLLHVAIQQSELMWHKLLNCLLEWKRNTTVIHCGLSLFHNVCFQRYSWLSNRIYNMYTEDSFYRGKTSNHKRL